LRNLVHALSYGLVMALGLWGMWSERQNWREHLIFYALFVSFAVVTAVFFGHTNYRSYLDVYWIVFAAGILAAFAERIFVFEHASREDFGIEGVCKAFDRDCTAVQSSTSSPSRS